MTPDSIDTDGDAVTLTLDTDEADPNVEIAKAVAALENEPTEDLPPLYGCIDHMAEQLYSEPPSPEARTEIRFDYEGYRVVLDQDGSATLRPLEDR